MGTHAISGKAGVDFASKDTTAIHKLGERQTASTGTVFEYVKASGTVAQYAAVKIDDDGTIAQLTTTIAGTEPTRVGAAQIAFSTNEYGWVAVAGPFSILTNAAVAADVKCYTTATAGKIDDDATGTKLIQNLKLTTAAGSATTGSAFAAAPMVINAQD